MSAKQNEPAQEQPPEKTPPTKGKLDTGLLQAYMALAAFAIAIVVFILDALPSSSIAMRKTGEIVMTIMAAVCLFAGLAHISDNTTGSLGDDMSLAAAWIMVLVITLGFLVTRATGAPGWSG